MGLNGFKNGIPKLQLVDFKGHKWLCFAKFKGSLYCSFPPFFAFFLYLPVKKPLALFGAVNFQPPVGSKRHVIL